MRILDEEKDVPLNRVILYLTQQEALEMKDALEQLLRSESREHEHVPSDDWNKEITLCTYDPKRLDDLSERSKKLIWNDR